MPSKRQKDLREFWPRYERHFTGDVKPMMVPPDSYDPPFRGGKLAQASSIICAAFLIGFIVWALLQ